MFQCPLTGELCLNEKNVQALKIINGVPVKINVCSGCGKKPFEDKDSALWPNFLKTIFHLLHIDTILSQDELDHALSTIKNKDQLNEFLEVLANRQQRKVDSVLPCPKCGTDLNQILKGTWMGCDNCYNHFYDIAYAIIDKVQAGNTKHTGKQPKKVNVESLKKEMELAIKEERYEEAAKYRDQIKELDK